MNAYSEINLKISQYQQDLSNFENRLHDSRFSNQLTFRKIQDVASFLEHVSKSAKSKSGNEKEHPELKATIVALKVGFEHKLISSAGKLIELAQNGIIAPDAYLKAQRLLSMAQFCLNSPQISDAFRQQLETIIINLNVLLCSDEVLEKSDAHTSTSLTKLNDYSGVLQVVLTHLTLTLKEIGPISQVSKGFSTLCNHETLWEKKCKTYHNVELNNLQHQKTYKNLYKSETAWLKFNHDRPGYLFLKLDYSLFFGAIKATFNNEYANVGIDLKMDKFRIKHLKKLIINTLVRDYSKSLVNGTTPISDIRISQLGKDLENNQKVNDIPHCDEVALFSQDSDKIPLLSLRSPSEKNREAPPQSVAASYARIINSTFHRGIKAEEKMIDQFMQRGGVIQILEGGKPSH